MLRLGEYNKLKVLRGTSVGFYLGDDEGNDVLLPHKYIPLESNVGDELEVFLYKDSEDRIIATTLKPAIQLHQFACLNVKDVTQVGAFLDWGLEKDLFVPFREQNQKLKAGDYTIVYLYLDEQTDRLVASCKVDKFFQKENIDLETGQEVDLLVMNKTDLGFNVVVNNTYRGLVYENEIFKMLAWGDETKGYVKLVREDGKIDISLKKLGYDAIEPAEQQILDQLKAAGGSLQLNDKSDPIDIQTQLQMSKKVFKKAIGGLYRQKLIVIEDGGIKLV
jgi:uncharacterized protein